MKKSRFNEAQIIGVLREQEAGSPTAEVCRRHGCDGTTAAIVSRLDAARDLKQRAVVIEAGGSGAYARMDIWLRRSDYPNMAMHVAAKMIWNRTDLKPKDVNTAHLYDGFTWLAMNWLEALGLCGEGESGAFIEGGHRMALEGELPLNTNGGQLSEGRMHGSCHLHEAVLQIRGQAGQRQLKKQPQVSVVGNGGGSQGGAVVLRQAAQPAFVN